MALSKHKYRVIYVGHRDERRERPCFKRVREVVYRNGYITCSCFLWICQQIFCRHIMSITGGGHKDQAGLRWTKIYNYNY